MLYIYISYLICIVFQLHLLSCVRVTVPCEMCGAMMPRGEVAGHMTETCPKVVVACTFAEHGCHHKMTRADLSQHMSQATQLHLQVGKHYDVC